MSAAIVAPGAPLLDLLRNLIVVVGNLPPIEQVQQIIDDWLTECSEPRPRDPLGRMLSLAPG